MDKYLIVDERINVISEKSLINMGYKLKKIQQNPMFDEPVSAHPDIFAVKAGNQWFVDSSVAHLFNKSCSVTVINREVPKNEKYEYPDDICLNCACVGNRIICNARYTNRLILEYAKEHDIKIIDVKQGYAKCSVCIVSDSAIITEDDSIYEAATNFGIDVLKIRKGFIALEGYDYGFIGGCSGLIDKNTLVFNGKIENHPDFDEIRNFCRERDVEVISLCQDALYDIGSILADWTCFNENLK